ncbi:LLM class flavin-dependent oxidoreductase [Parapedobacter indicus]|uniref:Luciferase-like monooxygenase n=1 Tax=Parapedobacter indicus TaxID=1477437 RepID=A0A1I3J942_9SPHI|nr:LLM class flavin-dependent oxidoreductase [Parapedobacter indicus]PPL02429.1 luciferase family oxidoreductase group 1 [Parapedobacter indicus]SFI56488.1 luciferase family oxidoreductase, group 1 [Parapedobacter indicus]
MAKQLKLSALDLSVIIEGGNAATAIARTVEIARLAEQLGYERIWLAEHHNMEYIASSATSVLIGHVADKTTQIRVGSGGIMLPNHAPLAIAEQFGTLETLYPGRIDLGLGRAPGTDQLTAMALRRNNLNTAYHFPSDVKELQLYFGNDNSDGRVRAFPGEGLNIPIWILGSSTDSAYLAAEMGLPYAFAAHFAPAQFRTAISIYREHFKPSAQLDKPYVLACVNVIAADTDEEAHVLATSMYRMFLGIVTNTRKPLQPPVPSMDPYWSPDVENAVKQMTACTFIGGAGTLASQLSRFVTETGIDELMTTGNIYDQGARLKSYRILKEVLS